MGSEFVAEELRKWLAKVGTSDDIADPSSARGALYEATRLRDQQFVALVKGGGNMTYTRDRILTGFNTPLLPEVLICTQVG
jgi:hypothetical protein